MPQKTILVIISKSDNQLAIEALQAALVLASFEHRISLGFTDTTIHLLEESAGKLTSMLNSLDLYDIDTPWYLSSDVVERLEKSENSVKCNTTTLPISKPMIHRPAHNPVINYSVANKENGFDAASFHHVLIL